MALAILLLPVVAVINGVLIPQVSEEDFHNPQLYAVAPSGFSWPAFLSMLVMAGIVAPFAEELAFRGLLFPWLRKRLGVTAAALLSGLIFAILHGVPVLIPALAAIGVALALLYQRCGSLWPVIVAHGAFNAFMVIMLYAALAAGLELP
jgi:membrane protease YdiL (CAAX protease family)